MVWSPSTSGRTKQHRHPQCGSGVGHAMSTDRLVARAATGKVHQAEQTARVTADAARRYRKRDTKRRCQGVSTARGA